MAWLKGWRVEIDPMEYRTGPDIEATLPLPTSGKAELWVACEANPRPYQIAYPERFAQQALGHNSKAVHRAYPRRAQVKLLSLQSYERKAADGCIIQLPQLSPTTQRNGQKVEEQKAGC